MAEFPHSRKNFLRKQEPHKARIFEVLETDFIRKLNGEEIYHLFNQGGRDQLGNNDLSFLGESAMMGLLPAMLNTDVFQKISDTHLISLFQNNVYSGREGDNRGGWGLEFQMQRGGFAKLIKSKRIQGMSSDSFYDLFSQSFKHPYFDLDVTPQSLYAVNKQATIASEGVFFACTKVMKNHCIEYRDSNRRIEKVEFNEKGATEGMIQSMIEITNLLLKKVGTSRTKFLLKDVFCEQFEKRLLQQQYFCGSGKWSTYPASVIQAVQEGKREVRHILQKEELLEQSFITERIKNIAGIIKHYGRRIVGKKDHGISR